MKAATSGMIAHIAQGQTSLAVCWRITRTDGLVIGTTEHDENLLVDGVLHLAENGFARLNLSDKSNLDESTMQVDGQLDSVFTRADLVSRLYDSADVEISLVNWTNLTQGKIILLTGQFGPVTVKEYGFSVELRSLSFHLTHLGGELCSPDCRVDFGSARCAPGGLLASGVAIDSLAQIGTVTVTDGSLTLTGAGIVDIGKPLDGGLLTWLTGNNAGLSVEAKTVDPATQAIVLYLPTIFAIQVGDTFKLMVACDKNFVTCKQSYANGINFQGEPHVPGADHLLDYPDFHAPHS